MATLRLRNVTLGYGGNPVLDGIDFEIEEGERVALVGRNGEGKSTLMRLMLGDLVPDEGEVVRAPDSRVALLNQQVPHDLQGSIFDAVAEGLGNVGDLLAEYHQISLQLASGRDQETLLQRLEEVQHVLERQGGWHLKTRVESVLSRLALDPDADVTTLSGGLKRRVLLGQTLVAEPHVLLLDEPTNHLDIPAIEGLENVVLGFRGAICFVTHDRAFLKRLATRIIELDRGQLRSYPGDYALYLRRKSEELDAEETQNAVFDKKLAQEEAWIRQGIKARRTRNEGRVRALIKMREEHRARRGRTGQAKLRLEDAERSGKRVIEATAVSFSYTDDDGKKPIIREFSTNILRGDKVGIIGPNGSGKTTLLRLLLGDLKSHTGRIHHGTRLEVAYFDQHRAALDENRSVGDNVADGADKIVFQGKPRHVISYLQSFLFPPARVRSPVASLSGGERNRLLLARLFTKPFNVLVMDEPTNDLDAETLDLLEELLYDFKGTLLLVSHDRDFLDNVVTSTLVLEGDGRIGEYAGGYSDWLLQRPQDPVKPQAKSRQEEKPRAKPRERPKKLSFKEKQELAELPAKIEALEAEQEELHGRMADPELYRQDDGQQVAAAKERLTALETELTAAYERWETLEALAE